MDINISSSESIIFSIFIIFTSAAALATIALFARQALLVAYIAVGIILGPSVLNFVPDTEFSQQIAKVGIMFLLFLLGLNLHPQKLIASIKQSTLITFGASLIFALIGFIAAMTLQLPLMDQFVIAAAFMFSSTIIGLKLLPTTVLHHQHVGEIIISILLLQDILAIILLLLIETQNTDTNTFYALGKLALALPGLIAFAFLVERFVLIKLMSKFDKIKEYIFLLAIGWCLGIAELAHYIGLSHETGAFIAGVAIAVGPISFYISESLKPIRDFFLVIFFFSLGASLDIGLAWKLLLPAIITSTVLLLIKPYVFKYLIQKSGESDKDSKEIGVRLGQLSEFSLLLGFVAFSAGLITLKASNFIQVCTIVSFILSTYLIVLKYPTPIAVSDKLRRD
ncbi:MAG: cation:proton antiporter [Gammaproteobacteria bacterium]|nr:MAG: cation:proton antiporter [Gammaproteobacteria bacterium]